MNSPSGGGETVYGWNPTMAKYWQGDEANPGGFLGVANNQFWNDYGKGYQEYGSDKGVAGASRNERRGIDELYNMSMDPATYMPDVAAGRQQNTDTAQGKYLNQNPAANGRNEYQGMDSPYFQKMVQSGLGDITDAYQQGTQQQTNALMNMSGVLGGGDHMKAVANNEKNLSRELADYTNKMYNSQYDRSGQMDESRLGRVYGAYEGERGRMLQGAQQGLGGYGISSDMFNQLIKSGGVDRSIDQTKRDFDWQEYQNKQNYGRNMLDWMGGYLSRAQGGIGGSSNVYGGGGGNGLGQALGTAMMGYGMFRS